MINIIRNANMLELHSVPPAVQEYLFTNLSYTHRQTYHGFQLVQRKRLLDQLRLANDPRAGSFKPHIDFTSVVLVAEHPMRPGVLVCPAGLYLRVCGILAGLRIETTLVDKREKRLPPANFANLARYPQLCNFRYKQAEALAVIDGSDGGIVVAGTGYGKTHICRLLPVVYNKSRILICTPGLSTLRALHREMTLLPYGNDVGLVGDGKKQINKRVILASADSLKHVPISNMELVIGDECHEYAAPSHQAQLSRVTDAKFIGFTASHDVRGDGADMVVEAIFGPKLLEISYQEAEANDAVVPIRVLMLEIGPIVGYNNTADGVKWERQCFWQNTVRNQAFAAAMRGELGSFDAGLNPQLLCMTRTTEHAFELRRYLPDWPIVYAEPADKVAFENRVERFKQMGLWHDSDVVCTDAVRDQAEQDFAAGVLRQCISTGCWKQGVNFVNLNVMARLDGSAGEIDNIQLPGRLSRIDGVKEEGVLIDSLDRFDEKAEQRSLKRMRSYRSRGWKVEVVKVNPQMNFWTP